MDSFSVRPIGFVRSPFREKVEAPRQAVVASAAVGCVELLPEFRDALSDLEGFDRIWLLFWFDRAIGYSPKVQPPRSAVKRGVFATRSPHRPNPIGMSAVRLERVEDLVLHVRELDILDGTPVIDIKPYIAYADAFGDARPGWLDERDPGASWAVRFDVLAEAQLAFLADEGRSDLRERITAALTLGPEPHAYRRIRKDPDGRPVLGVKEWRAHFRVDLQGERSIVVERITSGYKARELERGEDPSHALHRAFVARFG